MKPAVFTRLFGLLQDSSSGARQSSVEIITAFAEFGRSTYRFALYEADDPADDIRSKMMETDVLVRLVGLLLDQDSDVRRSSIKAISSLARFGRLTYHFVLCED